MTDLAGNSASATIGTISIAAATDQLVITSEPPATIAAGATFGLTAALENTQGQILTGFNGLVTISLGANPAQRLWAGRRRYKLSMESSRLRI